jgi:hypothetical protein
MFMRIRCGQIMAAAIVGDYGCRFFRSLPLFAARQEERTRCSIPSTLRLQRFTDGRSRTFSICPDLFKALYRCLEDLPLILGVIRTRQGAGAAR